MSQKTHSPESRCHKCGHTLAFEGRKQNRTNGHHNRVMRCKNEQCPVEETLRG